MATLRLAVVWIDHDATAAQAFSRSFKISPGADFSADHLAWQAATETRNISRKDAKAAKVGK